MARASEGIVNCLGWIFTCNPYSAAVVAVISPMQAIHNSGQRVAQILGIEKLSEIADSR